MGTANSRQEAFWEACGFGQVQQVRKFLSEGSIDVNWVSYTHDCCPIHVASQGKPEIVQMLLDAECNINAQDNRGNLAIHHAAMKGHDNIIELLMDNGSEISVQDKNDWSPLHCAAYWCHPEAVKVLIKRGCDVSLQNKDERTALHETCRSPEQNETKLGEIAAMLIEAGCDINIKSSDEGEADFTPLMFASYHGHPEVAQSLIAAGCDINACGTNQWTALHWAADRNHEELVYILLEAGANPTCRGERNELAADRTKNKELKLVLRNAAKMYKDLCSVDLLNKWNENAVNKTSTNNFSGYDIIKDDLPVSPTTSDKINGNVLNNSAILSEGCLVSAPIVVINETDIDSVNECLMQNEVNNTKFPELLAAMESSSDDAASPGMLDEI